MEEGPSRPAALWFVAAGTPPGKFTSNQLAAMRGGRNYSVT